MNTPSASRITSYNVCYTKLLRHIDYYFTVHGLSFVLFEAFHHTARGDFAVDFLVDDNNRRDTASTDAVNAFQGEHHVFGCILIILQLEILTNLGNDSGGALDVADRTATDGDDIRAAGILMELGIKGNDSVKLRA